MIEEAEYSVASMWLQKYREPRQKTLEPECCPLNKKKLESKFLCFGLGGGFGFEFFLDCRF